MTNLIINKLDELIAYSTQRQPMYNYATSPIVQEYRNAVNKYLNRDRSSYHQPLHELQIALFCDIQNRGTKYKAPPVKLTYATNFPPAYDDLTKLFCNFQILTCDATTFFDAWVYGWANIDTPTEDEKKHMRWQVVELVESTDDDGTTSIVEGDIISSWDNARPITASNYQYQQETAIANAFLSTSDIEKNGTAEKELANINAFNKWLCDASADAYDLMLWEEMGEIIEQPKTQDIAKIVFINKKLKECKEIYNLPIHIPTCMV